MKIVCFCIVKIAQASHAQCGLLLLFKLTQPPSLTLVALLLDFALWFYLELAAKIQPVVRVFYDDTTNPDYISVLVSEMHACQRKLCKFVSLLLHWVSWLPRCLGSRSSLSLRPGNEARLEREILYTVNCQYISCIIVRVWSQYHSGVDMASLALSVQ